MERMTAGKFRHLPVVEQGRLAGIISIGDVVKCAARGDRGRDQRAARVHRDGVTRILSRYASAATTSSSRLERALGGLGAERRSLPAARWKSNSPMLPDARADHDVGRIAREPRARDAILHDVERLDHHGRKPGPARGAEECGAWRSSRAPNMPNRPRLATSSSIGGSGFVGAVIRDRGAAAEQVGVDVDGDHQARAERARGRDRHRIDQRAVHQPALAEPHRRENSRQRIGGAQRIGQPAARDPDLVAGADLGRDRRIAHRQLVDRDVADGLVELVGESCRRRAGRSPPKLTSR